MADYAITGKKGGGKTLFAVATIRDALRAGKRVATNVDIHLAKMLPPNSRATLIRLPDRPTADDLEAIGRGQDGVIEEENGVIVLDETSTFFNARAYGDKERQPLLDWLVHSRKYGWDVYYICQGLEQIDKQLRTTMIEYHIGVKRTDKWPIPLITPLGKLVGLDIRFPKLHIGIVKHGVERDSLTVERRVYRAHDLFGAYDTQQLFLDRSHPKATGLYSVLSPWHTTGRYLPPPPPLLVRFVYGVLGRSWYQEAQEKPPAPRKHPLAAMLAKLPPDQAIRHWKRLDSLGAFACVTRTGEAG